MVDACLCYSCDKNYLLPTFVSALQARRRLDRRLADIVVILVGEFPDAGGSVSRLFAENDVVLVKVTPASIEGLSVQFARHFLDRLLDPRYERIIHIDSDTQIVGTLDPLFEVDLPRGRLMASPDPLAVRIHEEGRFWEEHRTYFKHIGMSDQHLGRYVNTGLFGGWRKDLALVGKECRSVCSKQNKFRFIEQDALNILFGEKINLISMKWNFPVFFLDCGFHNLILPSIYHYMSNPRPWQGPFQPWGHAVYQVYVDTIACNPALSIYRERLRWNLRLKYILQQKYKHLLKHSSWDREDVRARLLKFESEAFV